MEYLVHILVLVSLYTTLTFSLDLIAGHCGLLSLAQAAFYGIGAYTSAIVALAFGVPFPGALAAAAGVAVLMSMAVSTPSVYLHDDYFAIVSFCFQMIVFSVLNNWLEVTRGPLGISGIPQPVIFGRPVGQLEFLALAAGLAVVSYLVVTRLTKGPFGRVLHAMREDDVFSQSLGKNTFYFKTVAFAVSAALAAAAGSMYAHYISYIDPSNFTVTESILILSMVIIGGAGSRLGPLLGAVTLVLIPELLRFAGFPPSIAGNLRQMTYGALLILILVVRPRGLLGSYGFEAK